MTDQPLTGLGVQDIIGDKRDQILRLAARYGAGNVRVFGSVARGEARPDSDVDLLVDFRDGSTIWDAVGLWQDLQTLLNRKVSLVGEDDPETRFMRRVLQDAVPL
jgi:predicted nucleotidyltransferase